MGLEWIHENPPYWDENKKAIVAGTQDGVFQLPDHQQGELLPGEWWRVEKAGKTVGYGWMDVVWGDGEILVAVSADERKHGVGSFILDRLEQEAALRGLNYLYNVVRPSHPERSAVTVWLTARRFETCHDTDRLMRRVGPTSGT